MSNARAISAVSHLIVEQIQKVLQPDYPELEKLVTVGPPHLKREGRKDPQVNVFLYQVGIDAAWRNQDLPNKVKPGERAYPLLPLRLQYLITTFGTDDDDQQSHDLLGSIMLLFHNEPILPRVGEAAIIAESGLAQQYEPVRLTFQPLSIDDISKLWSGFQSLYHLSVAYEATVLLIESDKPTNSAPPVLARGGNDDRGFDASTLAGEPALESVRFAEGLHAARLDLVENAAGWRSDELILTGRNLDHPDLRLVFRHPALAAGYIATIAKPIERTSSRLRIRVPWGLQVYKEKLGAPLTSVEVDANKVDVTTDAWLSGVYTLAAARAVRVKGDDGAERLDRLYTTGPIAFGMMPELDIPPEGFELRITSASPKKATMALRLKTKVHRSAIAGTIDQQLKLFAGNLELVGRVTSADGSTLTWTSLDGDTLDAALPSFDPLSLFLRVQIDGIDSTLLPPPTLTDATTRKSPPRRFDPELIVKVVRT